MQEAVQFLSSQDEKYQHCGASYIQHNTFISDKAKEEVPELIFDLTLFVFCLYFLNHRAKSNFIQCPQHKLI